jgi:hypothetical protein
VVGEPSAAGSVFPAQQSRPDELLEPLVHGRDVDIEPDRELGRRRSAAPQQERVERLPIRLCDLADQPILAALITHNRREFEPNERRLEVGPSPWPEVVDDEEAPRVFGRQPLQESSEQFAGEAEIEDLDSAQVNSHDIARPGSLEEHFDGGPGLTRLFARPKPPANQPVSEGHVFRIGPELSEDKVQLFQANSPRGA